MTQSGYPHVQTTGQEWLDQASSLAKFADQIATEDQLLSNLAARLAAACRTKASELAGGEPVLDPVLQNVIDLAKAQRRDRIRRSGLRASIRRTKSR